MNVLQRPYHSEADLSAILAFKQRCSAAQNLFDRPTISDLRWLLAQAASPRMPNAFFREEAWREMTQRSTVLWEDASGQLVAYALIVQPGSSLTFQITPDVQGHGLETEILVWGLGQMQALAQARGKPRDLWCRCHANEHERRDALEAAGFQPLAEQDLRLAHPLTSLPLPVSLPHGFWLRCGVSQTELDAYQELHQAVFDGVSMSMDYHEARSYQSELDLIAVEESGRFVAFCQCELTWVADRQGERMVGEVGLIGTRPNVQRQGLGRALLLTGLRLMHERGATSISLETSELNVSAQHLFTSVGFTHLSTWHWYTKTVELA